MNSRLVSKHPYKGWNTLKFTSETVLTTKNRLLSPWFLVDSYGDLFIIRKPN